MQDHTDNANVEVPLAVVKQVEFSVFLEIKVHTSSFGKKNKTDQSFSL